jgi:hypothetical protein
MSRSSFLMAGVLMAIAVPAVRETSTAPRPQDVRLSPR